MGGIMDGYELVKKLKSLVETHTKLGCSIHQAGYKDDYFALFRVAHDNRWFASSAHPRLTGDAISDRVYEMWMGEDEELTKKRGKTLRAVLSMWDEWHYALEKYGILSEE